MKITEEIVKEFEQEQINYGTEIALSNVIFTVAHELLRDINVKKVTVQYGKKERK
jgi:hypothetical protein